LYIKIYVESVGKAKDNIGASKWLDIYIDQIAT